MGRAEAALKPDQPQKYKQPKDLAHQDLAQKTEVWADRPTRDNAAVQE
jgi:hypothetical protein